MEAVVGAECGFWLLTDPRAQVDVVYAGLGIMVPPCHLKRKVRDVEVDKWMGVPDDEYLRKAWRSEANRRWSDL